MPFSLLGDEAGCLLKFYARVYHHIQHIGQEVAYQQNNDVDDQKAQKYGVINIYNRFVRQQPDAVYVKHQFNKVRAGQKYANNMPQTGGNRYKRVAHGMFKNYRFFV